MNIQPIRTVVDGRARDTIDSAWDKLYEQANARLLERMEHHGLTPDAVPVQDMTLVYRIPNAYQGVLHLPETADDPNTPFDVGLLIFSGVEGLGVLESHGILPGDYVQFAKFAGEQASADYVNRAVQKAVADGRVRNNDQAEALFQDLRAREMSKKKLLRIQAPMIHQSVDLFGRMYGPKPTMRIVRLSDAKRRTLHVIEPVVANIL